MQSALMAVALFIGTLLALQASVNIQLNKAAATPYGAALLQLSLAAAALAVVGGVTGGLGSLGELPRAEPWMLLGGIFSPLYITSAILLFPRLGALTSVGLFVTGQMLVSVLLDAFGLIGVPQRPLSVFTVAGVGAVLGGILIVVLAQGTVALGRFWYAWALLGLVAGGVLPVQGAINAALRATIGNPMAVSTVSFTVATLTIAVVYGLLRLGNKTPTIDAGALKTMPWWGWLGGFAAATYVTANFLLFPVVGAATTVALTVTGQQLASAAIDHFGLFRLPGRKVAGSRLAGLGLLVAGSALVKLL